MNILTYIQNVNNHINLPIQNRSEVRFINPPPPLLFRHRCPIANAELKKKCRVGGDLWGGKRNRESIQLIDGRRGRYFTLPNHIPYNYCNNVRNI